LFPDSIAAHENKVAVLIKIVFIGIGVRRNRMLLRLEVFLLFILKVSESSRKIQVTIDAPFSNYASCFRNPVNFYLALWLMIEAQSNTLTSLTHNGARVARICHKEFFGLKITHQHVCSAADRIKL